MIMAFNILKFQNVIIISEETLMGVICSETFSTVVVKSTPGLWIKLNHS
jgi:hypothetical protein